MHKPYFTNLRFSVKRKVIELYGLCITVALLIYLKYLFILLLYVFSLVSLQFRHLQKARCSCLHTRD